MFISYVLVLLINQALSHPYCTGTSCDCYNNFKNTSCLAICPSGFVESNFTCLVSVSSSLISSKFFNNWDFNNFEYGGFSFDGASVNPPIITKDRGAYFNSTNNLLSDNNWVLSPTFTLRFTVKVISDGALFHVFEGGSEYFQVYMSLSEMCVSANLTKIETIKSNSESALVYSDELQKLCFNLNYSTWYNIRVNVFQDLGHAKFTAVYSTKVPASTLILFNSLEFLKQSNKTNYEIGKADGSFKGFLYEIYLDNSIKESFNVYYSYIECDYPFYYNYLNNTCIECTQSSTNILCTNSEGYCFSPNCSSCSDFFLTSCDSCNINELAPNCGLSYFEAENCSESKVLYKSICIYPPTFADNNSSSPVLNILFDPFNQFYGNIFFSGSNNETYAPFWEPEEDDPYPVKNRGLYFDGFQFLQSKFEISLNLDFYLAVWTWSSGQNTIWSSKHLSILEQCIGKLCLFNGLDLYCTHTYSPTPTSFWNYLAVSVKYDESARTTTFSNILNLNIIETIQIPGNSFYNEPSIVYIGQDDSGNFIGFVYQILVWNTADNIPGTYFYSFCTSSTTNCAWAYTRTYFFNAHRNLFQECDLSCVTGCSKWGTCNVCEESDCSLCQSFYSNCTEAQGSTCFEGLQLTDQKDCCHFECRECFGVNFYNCRKCFNNKVFVVNVCVAQCPIGFYQTEDYCTAGSDRALDVTFGTLESEVFDRVEGLKFVMGGGGYTDFNNNDPIPAVGRGLYFTNTAHMRSEEFLMFYTFSMVLYMKHYGPGTILTKGDNYLVLKTHNFDLFINQKTFSFSISSAGVWKFIAITLESSIDGDFSLQFYQNSQMVRYSGTEFVFNDTISNLFIGSTLNSFTGFIYKLSIFTSSTVWSAFESTPVTCASSLQQSCLSPCDFSSFQLLSSCISCTNCSFGCHTKDHCNLCADKYCASCSVIAGECFNCSENFLLIDKSCICPKGMFISSGNQCKNCNFNCKECSDVDKKCTDCGENSEIIEDSCYCKESFIKVLTENQYFECGCPENSELINGTCVCVDGFARVNETCKPCNKNCQTCGGVNFYECLSCNSYHILNQGVCYSNCTLGYTNIDDMCKYSKNSSGLFYLKFDSKVRPLIDSINNLGIQYSGSPAGRSENLGPSIALYRGLYFDGEGDYFKFPSPDIPVPIFYHKFSVLLCINFHTETNPIFVKEIDGKLLIYLEVELGTIKATLMFNGNYFSIKSDLSVMLNQWTYVLLSVDHNWNAVVSIDVNDYSGQAVQASKAPFLDFTNSPIVFGLKDSASFKGFLYLIFMHNEYLKLKDIDFEVKLCSSIEAVEDCLSVCPFNTFLNTTDLNCYECLSECESAGCVNNYTCTLCTDVHCIECSDFDTCTKCEDFYEVKNGLCTMCEPGYYFKNSKCYQCKAGSYLVGNTCITCANKEYFDFTEEICKPCMSLCNICETNQTCTNCVENAEFTNQSLCSCLENYTSNYNECVPLPNYFDVTISLNFENKVRLSFSEIIEGLFNESSLTLTLNSQNLDFNVFQLSALSYELDIDYPELIKEGSKLNLNFSTELKSVNNSILFTSYVSVTVYPKESDPLVNLIASAKSYARNGVTSGLSIAIGCSLASFDPTSIFSFLSTAEIYYPISFYSCEFPENMKVFLGSLRVQSMLPNIFAELLWTNSGSEVSDEFKNLGFKRDLILVNTGVNITIGACTFFVFILLKILNLLWFCKQYVKVVKKKFEYGIFIRFWVQSFLEFLIGAYLSLSFNTFSSPLEKFDFFIALVVMVLLT